MDAPVENLVIVGGGTAGWMTAAYLAKVLQGSVHVTVTNSNYYCIFSGLGFTPNHPLPLLSYKPQSCARADKMFADIRRQQAENLTRFPTTYAYLRHFHQKHVARPEFATTVDMSELALAGAAQPTLPN